MRAVPTTRLKVEYTTVQHWRVILVARHKYDVRREYHLDRHYWAKKFSRVLRWSLKYYIKSLHIGFSWTDYVIEKMTLARYTDGTKNVDDYIAKRDAGLLPPVPSLKTLRKKGINYCVDLRYTKLLGRELKSLSRRGWLKADREHMPPLMSNYIDLDEWRRDLEVYESKKRQSPAPVVHTEVSTEYLPKVYIDPIVEDFSHTTEALEPALSSEPVSDEDAEGDTEVDISVDESVLRSDHY